MVPNDILIRMRDQQRSQFFEMGEDGQWTIKQGGGKNGPIVPSINPRESLKAAILQRSTDSPGNYDVFVDMIHQMLSYRPQERITAAEALEHPFIIAGEHSQTNALSASS
jgi:serine/threonine protein kinase